MRITEWQTRRNKLSIKADSLSKEYLNKNKITNSIFIFWDRWTANLNPCGILTLNQRGFTRVSRPNKLSLNLFTKLTTSQIILSPCKIMNFQYRIAFFARDVTAAIGETYTVFTLILQKIFYCTVHQHGRLVTWLQTENRQFQEP